MLEGAFILFFCFCTLFVLLIARKPKYCKASKFLLSVVDYQQVM